MNNTTNNSSSNDDEQSPPKNKQSLSSILENSNNNNDANAATNVEIVIRPDGKKVRRVRKTTSSSAASLPATSATTTSEIYIRPDGKKVRRVRRQTSLQPTSSANTTTPTTPAAIGEVYINKDGKKVRRVAKPKATATSSPASAVSSVTENTAASTPAAATSPAASPKDGEIYTRADGKRVRRVRRAASTTTTDAEVYINKDGKKVRRVRKPKTAAAAAPDTNKGTIYTNADGQRVRRRVVRRSQSSDGMPTTSSGLGHLLSKPVKNSGAATVAEGEVYINAQGKRVRRVRKPKGSASVSASDSNGSNASIGQVYINKDGKRVRRVLRQKSAGSQTSTSSGDGGEIYVRADGKRVRRVRRPKSTSSLDTATSSSGLRSGNNSSGDSSAGSEIYRRADGKLVRRVRRSQSTRASSTTKPLLTTTTNPTAATATTPSGNTTRASKDSDTTPAAGDAPQQQPAVVTANNSVQLTSEEEAIATTYRKMKRMGLPDDAVRHKMTVSKVAPKIVAAVFGEPWQEPPVVADSKPAAAAAANTSVQLTPEEEAIATTYRKMKRMGLPDDAVRHKMTVNEVVPKIVAAVFGEPWQEPASSEATPPAEDKRPTLTDHEHGVADTYQKMLQMGMPAGAVRHKMLANQVHPKVIAFLFQEEWTEPEADKKDGAATAAAAAGGDDDDSTAATVNQYKKMLQMGLPPDAVQHKMRLAGVDPSITEKVLRTDDTTTAASSSAKPAAASPTSLSPHEEATANQYRKMLKMGLPPDAVRHKMVLAEVEEKVIAAVLDQSASSTETTATTSSSSGTRQPTGTAVGLTAEEEQSAQQYRKMLKMGLPPDVVRHKMVLAEVEEKIIAAVLAPNDAGTSSATSPSNSPNATTKETPAAATSPAAPNAVAYVVVVGDDETDVASRPTTANNDDDKSFELKPDEKFAVKVSDESNPESGSKLTKFFTLKELAELSGKNPSELEAVVMEKRKRGASPPRFSLLPLNEQKFEVSLPQAPAAAAAPTAPTIPSKNVKQVMDGQEVVDSDVAQAARAVTALGNGDMAALLEKLNAGDMKDLLEKLHEAEKRQKKLEKQLAQAGVAIAEDIEYGEAKLKVEEIAKRMNEIGGSDVVAADKEEQNRLREEYFKLEQQMERYNTALMLTEEYQAEQDRIEQLWEATNEPQNQKALRQLRRHMPVNIRHLSEADLTSKPSPNGKYLPRPIAKKFKRTNVLQCLRLNPDDIECMHPATLENMRVTGLTLTERRALYAHLKSIGPKWKRNKAEKMTERKWTWYQMMKSNFKESIAPYQRHVDQYGPPENHPYKSKDNPNGCPMIGKQCPIKADKVIDYDGDYGWTEEAEFEVSEVRKADVEDSGAKAMAEARELAKEKKANERGDILKKHYKGKLLQVSKANGSCENMDESMDNMENNIMKWIEFIMDKGADDKKELANFTDALNEFKLKLLDFAQRSGMQMTGKRTAGGGSPDIRSSVEASLAEEVGECSRECFKFIRDRMKELGARDTRITKTIEMLEGIFVDLHDRNLAVLQKLGVKRMERSRKLKTTKDLKKAVEEKRKPKEEEEEPTGGGPPRPPGGGGRGGLLGDIAGRGRGRGGGGRGGLLDAIGGRGRGGRGGGGRGRGGLMDAIQGRGKKPGGGGRGGLLDAIQGRGKPSGGGGRGGLMDAIAARGRGRGGGGGGGRGGLMAAIAARGGN